MPESPPRPRIKICGLTRPEDVACCLAMGVDAVGFVFYRRSPRFVERDRVRGICRSLPEAMARVGVFVDETYDHVLSTARFCGLTAVQLHGRETPEMVKRLRDRDLVVIKTLFGNSAPGFEAAADYPASAFLVECAGGPLPGGNAMAWNWADARPLGRQYPMILAGGLTAENVGQAVLAALPDAVDVSSSLESGPGKKNPVKIGQFVEALRKTSRNAMPRRIF